MIGRRIVVAVDFADDNAWATKDALDNLLGDPEARLYLVHVIAARSNADRDAFPVDPIAALPHHDLIDDCVRQIHALHATHERIEDAVVRVGDPADEIIAYAASVKADLIVIATRGHRGLKRLLHGSTAAEVIRRADCPVLVVRPQNSAPRLPENTDIDRALFTTQPDRAEDDRGARR